MEAIVSDARIGRRPSAIAVRCGALRCENRKVLEPSTEQVVWQNKLRIPKYYFLLMLHGNHACDE